MGKCGLSDCHRKFHTLVYGIFMSENSFDAHALLTATIRLLERNTNCLVKSILCDGAIALKTAIKELDGSVDVLDCFAHISRPLSRNKSNRGGTRGSIARYLLSKGFGIDTIVSIMCDFLLFFI